MKFTYKIFSNATTQWLATGINAVIGIVLVPFLLAQLGQDGYGLIGVLGSITTLAMFVDFGFRGALSRELAEQIALDDRKGFNELTSTALGYYLLVGSLPALILVALAPQIVLFFKIPEELMADAIFLVRWYASASVFLTLAGSTFRGVLASHAKFATINAIDISVSLLRSVSLFLVLGFSESGLVGWGAVLLLAQLLTLPLLWRFAGLVHPTLSLSRSLISKHRFGQLYHLGSNLFVLRLTTLASTTSDPIILSAFLGPGAVALYTPALSLVRLVRPLVNTLSEQLHPIATSFHVANNRPQLQVVLIRGTRFAFLMGVGACVYFLVFADPLISIWLGNELGGDYVVTVAALILWALIDLTLYAEGSQWPLLLGMKKLQFVTWLQVVLAIANILLSIVFVGYTRLGVLGVVLPTLVISFIRRPIVAVYAARVCGLDLWTYFRFAYLKGLVAMAVLLGLASMLRFVVEPDSLVSLSVCTIIYAILWASMTWFWGFEDNDRTAFRAMWSRLNGYIAQRLQAKV